MGIRFSSFRELGKHFGFGKKDPAPAAAKGDGAASGAQAAPSATGASAAPSSPGAPTKPAHAPGSLGFSAKDQTGGPTRAPSMAASVADKPGAIVEKLAALEAGGKYKVVRKITQPNQLTSISAKFKMSDYGGLKLQPGEEVLIEVPAALRNMPARFAVLGHRQAPEETVGIPEGKTRDETPGLTALAFYAPDAQGEKWRTWNTSNAASGPEGAKYAERRSDIEFENFYSVGQYGHSAVGGGSTSKSALHAHAIRARNVGKSPVRLHEIIYQVMPKFPDVTDEVIFTPGTNLGDPHSQAGQSFGGGPRKGTKATKYPHSLVLNGHAIPENDGHTKLPEGWKRVGDELRIELKPGLAFTAAEIACGDTHPEPKANGKEQRGWATLRMGLRRANGSTDWFTRGQGIPPRGVLIGAPTAGARVAQPGDTLIVQAEADTAYVMGVRLWYSKPGATTEPGPATAG
jgi:hypothetical protein